MALSPQDPPQRRGSRRGTAVCLPCRTDASGQKPRSAHASVLSPPLARVFASASSAWKEQRLLLLFPRPPRALSQLPRKRLLQRELYNGPVGEPESGPGVCRAWDLLLLLRARGSGAAACSGLHGERASARSGEEQSGSSGLAAEGLERRRRASGRLGHAPRAWSPSLPRHPHPPPRPWWTSVTEHLAGARHGVGLRGTAAGGTCGRHPRHKEGICHGTGAAG